MSSAGATKNKPKKTSNLRILWIPGRKKHNRKGTYNPTKNGLPQTYGMQPRKNKSWTLGGPLNQSKIINAFLLMYGLIQCKCAYRYGLPSYSEMDYTGGNEQGEGNLCEESLSEDEDQTPYPETYDQTRPSTGAHRHECIMFTEAYECIFQNIFIDTTYRIIEFGNANQMYNQSRIAFYNSTLKSLPRSLVDTFTKVQLLNLTRLQIETIERDALRKGQHIKELLLSHNNIATLDAGMFDYLHSLQILMMDGNNLSSIPPGLFRYTRYMRVISLASNKLHRIDDGTFRHNPNLESVNVASNRLLHFDLSLIPSLYDADAKNNLLQELKIPDGIGNLDASNNQIHSVVIQSGPFFIEVLNISNNKINTTAWLKPFAKLLSLDLSFNEIEDITTQDFKQLTALNTLKLNNNRLFTFKISSLLNRSLRTLNLSHNNLVYVENNLKQFQQMKELYLDHNSIVTVNLDALRELRNLTLSHNDWDCGSLVKLSSRLSATTVVDYGTESHCPEHYKLERGICCTASDIPYHDRLINYMVARANGRCSNDTVYNTAEIVSSLIANFGPPPSSTLVKEVQDLKSDVQRLEHSTAQARNQVNTDAEKTVELMRTYGIPQEQGNTLENLSKVFDHLKQRDALRKTETAAREEAMEKKRDDVDVMWRKVVEVEMERRGKVFNYDQLEKEIKKKTQTVKILQSSKNKNPRARKNSK